jgi:uncharacterized Zn-finger protein
MNSSRLPVFLERNVLRGRRALAKFLIDNVRNTGSIQNRRAVVKVGENLHNDNQKNENFVCAYCTQTFRFESHWVCVCSARGAAIKWTQVDHNRTVHLERRPFACDKCERKFTSRTGLMYHEKRAHDYVNCERTEEGNVSYSTL